MTRMLTRILRLLRQDQRAVAVTEFALSFPILLGLGLTGLELANRAIIQMKVNQLAVHMADNASRIGDTSMIDDRRIYEGDLQDLFFGAEIQGGTNFDLYGRGRVILSSLEVVPGTDEDQYIHWQRCMGNKVFAPRYGMTGDGLSSSFPGMGPPGEEVIAFSGEAVMFVEVAYDYEPLIGDPFGWSATMTASSSFAVRDDRDLAQIYQRNPSDPDTVASCNSYGTTSYSTPPASSPPSSGGSGAGSSTTSTSSSSGGSTSSSGGASSGGASSGGASSSSSGGSTSSSGGMELEGSSSMDSVTVEESSGSDMKLM